jgi:6-phosphogluconolactonase (cycloisomerase 2 family)
MTGRARLATAAASCVLILCGCGTPFFIAEEDLLALLYGKEILYTAESGGLAAYEIDRATGRIDRISGSPFGAGCFTTLAATPQASYVYGLLFYSDQIRGFRIDSAGAGQDLGFALTALDPRALTVDRDGRFAYVAHDNSLSSYGIDPATGALTALGAPLGLYCAPASVAIESRGRTLYAGDANRVQLLQLDGTSGVPTLLSPLPMGDRLRSMAVHPDGTLYGVGTASTTERNIFAFRIDASGGLTDLTGGAPYRLGFGPVCVTPSAVAVDPSRNYLYATSSAKDLFQYRIDGGTGALSITRGVGATNIARVTTSTAGRYVLVGGEAIRVYRVGDGGTLTEVAGSPFPTAAGVVNDLIIVNKVNLP